MTESRLTARRALAALTCLLGLSSLGLPAVADEWPQRPIKLVVPWAPGGVADFLARTLAGSLTQQLGQTVIVENKAGGATNIGSEVVARAQPDGYTLLMASSNNPVNMTLFKSLNYDFAREFTPVVLVGYTPLVLVTNPSVPGKDLAAFLRYAKANPGKLSYASAGIGSPAHLAAVKLVRAADLQMVHVPYKGAAPAALDLMGGRVQALITNVSSVVGYIKAGRLNALAITGKSRVSALPQTPTFAEAGLSSYDATGWYGIVAPHGTPEPIVQRLAGAVAKALADPTVAGPIEKQGVAAVANGGPAPFSKVIDSDIVGYRKLIQTEGITAD